MNQVPYIINKILSGQCGYRGRSIIPVNQPGVLEPSLDQRIAIILHRTFPSGHMGSINSCKWPVTGSLSVTSVKTHSGFTSGIWKVQKTHPNYYREIEDLINYSLDLKYHVSIYALGPNNQCENVGIIKCVSRIRF